MCNFYLDFSEKGRYLTYIFGYFSSTTRILRNILTYNNQNHLIGNEIKIQPSGVNDIIKKLGERKSYGNFDSDFYIRKIIASTEWNDWYTGSPHSVSSIYSSQITITNDTHVVYCVFINIESSIILTSANILLCVEECSFIDCYRNNNGGAIYCNSDSNCVLNKVCAYQCNTSSSYYGQFCHILVSSASNNLNIVCLVSVCKCAPNENNDRSFSIYCYYGNISLNNVNSSANRCNQYSGAYIYKPDISDTKQSTFSNNTDDYSICIGIGYYLHQMSFCNIIRNHQNQSFEGIITIWGAGVQLTLSNCVIDMNTAASNYAIYVMSGNLTLNNCYLQSNLLTFGTVIAQSNILDSQSLVLNHYESQYCDVITIEATCSPDQTPIITVNPSSIEPFTSYYYQPTNESTKEDTNINTGDSTISSSAIVGITTGTGVASVAAVVGIKYFLKLASETVESNEGELDFNNNPIVIVIPQMDKN